MRSCTALIPCSSLSRRLLAGLLTAWLLLVGGAAFAATRFVATSGNDSGNTCLSSDSPCKTITHALTQAVAGDTISVAAGTYNLALGETFPLTINKALTLTGAGAGSTILDATGANARVIEALFLLCTGDDHRGEDYRRHSELHCQRERLRLHCPGRRPW
ncbi:MAG: DUF1565 domain-containing protein [Candidatus Methylomirabilis sp.]|nr:DUF1565 domain-containing protein [Candidatus Methylomirabilis sp.]